MAISLVNRFPEFLNVIKAYPKTSIALGIVLIGLFSVLNERYGFYLWYVGVFASATILALGFDGQLYLYAFLLGAATAFAEIISKFNDEPLKSLKTPHALIYHVLNGLVSVFALRVLFVFMGTPAATDLQGQMKYVLVAGLGAMVIMRSKLFNIKIDNQDVSFGPEQIVKIYFSFMEAAIDRVRAKSRIDFVVDVMGNIKFDAVYSYTLTMLNAPQVWDKEKRKQCETSITAIQAIQEKPQQLKSYELGFLLLNNMGEDFVTELFADKDTKEDWWIQAPAKKPEPAKLLTVQKDSKLSVLPFVGTKEQLTLYFAYGPFMCSQELRKRLNWENRSDSEFTVLVSPKNVILKDYRLTFNKPTIEGSTEVGRANIIPESAARVEGVLYSLTDDQMKFVDREESEYQLMPIKVILQDSSEIEAVTYIAKATKENLQPSRQVLDLSIAGAIEHGLSPVYIEQLRALGNIEPNVALKTSVAGANA